LNSIPHRATKTPTLNNLAHGAPFESSRFYELYFSSDLAPGMQRSSLLLSANCCCGNRLPHGPHLNAPLMAEFLRLLKTASGRAPTIQHRLRARTATPRTGGSRTVADLSQTRCQASHSFALGT
jgi:hypothetical protein